jgi:hypothetical protein
MPVTRAIQPLRQVPNHQITQITKSQIPKSPNPQVPYVKVIALDADGEVTCLTLAARS